MLISIGQNYPGAPGPDAACPLEWLLHMQEAWGDLGWAARRTGKGFRGFSSHCCMVQSRNPSPWGGMTLRAWELAALRSAPEGSSCGKKFFCACPGEHLPWVPSHCPTSTGLTPLLPLANHALKHTRRACTTCSSSSTYQQEHLPQRHPRIGNRLKFCSTEIYLSEELTIVFNTCSLDLSLPPASAWP